MDPFDVFSKVNDVAHVVGLDGLAGHRVFFGSDFRGFGRLCLGRIGLDLPHKSPV